MIGNFVERQKVVLQIDWAFQVTFQVQSFPQLPKGVSPKYDVKLY